MALYPKIAFEFYERNAHLIRAANRIGKLRVVKMQYFVIGFVSRHRNKCVFVFHASRATEHNRIIHRVRPQPGRLCGNDVV